MHHIAYSDRWPTDAQYDSLVLTQPYSAACAAKIRSHCAWETVSHTWAVWLRCGSARMRGRCAEPMLTIVTLQQAEVGVKVVVPFVAAMLIGLARIIGPHYCTGLAFRKRFAKRFGPCFMITD